MPAMAGLGMIAMGLGAVELDAGLAAVASVYADPLGLPLKPFLVAGGLTKVSSVLSLWGFLPLPKDLACLGLAVPASLAVYGHYVVEGAPAAVPPAVYLCILAAYYALSSSSKSDTKKTK